MRKIIVAATVLLVLAAVNFSIYGREQLLANGRVVLLELAPVDPRSLMQGDYMALRFKIANDAFRDKPAGELKDGRMLAALDEHGVASFRRLADGTPPAAGEVLLRYRVRNSLPKFATNAFFFQEGQAAAYQNARYGEFRVAADGDMILTALRAADFTVLGLAGQSTTHP
ncbi:MAG: GDYXXLXY domain-containing protein [Pseudomonadota bacterium]